MKFNHSFILFFFSLFVVSAVVTGCKKEEDDDHNHNHNHNTPVNVNINITSPTSTDMFHLNDEVNINVAVTANAELHGWEVKLENLSDNNAVLFSKHAHAHGQSYNISETWTNNVTMHSDVKLTVSVQKTHTEGDVVTKSVTFHCHPM